MVFTIVSCDSGRVACLDNRSGVEEIYWCVSSSVSVHGEVELCVWSICLWYAVVYSAGNQDALLLLLNLPSPFFTWGDRLCLITTFIGGITWLINVYLSYISFRTWQYWHSLICKLSELLVSSNQPWNPKELCLQLNKIIPTQFN